MSELPSDPADTYALVCAGSLRCRDPATDPPAPALRSLHAPVPHRGGITAGMRALDVGSGAGDVALLLAELVGPQGQVIGVDTNAEILEVARARVRSAGWATVAFRSGDVLEMELEEAVDAVVGRWVLQYTPDPAALLRRARDRLRPGGIVAFQEIDLSIPPRTYRADRCTTR